MSDSAARSRAPWVSRLRRLSAWVLSGALVAGVSVSVAVGLYRFASSSERFALERVELVGAERLGRSEVVRLAGLPLGENVLQLDLHAAQRRIADHPWVRRAQIRRELPNRLRVEVVEYRAEVLAQVGPALFLVDSEGRPFKLHEPGDPQDLPVVTGLEPRQLVVGRPEVEERLKQLVNLLSAYPREPLFASYPLQEAHLEADGSLTLRIGPTAAALELGQPPWRFKLHQAARLLGEVGAGAAVASVSFDTATSPASAVVRLR